jgi:hypothetical protein
MAIAVPLIGIALQAGAMGYGAYESKRQGDRMKQAQDRAMDQQERQLDQYEQAREQREAMGPADRDRAIARALFGKDVPSETEFTSPLGLPGAASSARPTLLGL